MDLKTDYRVVIVLKHYEGMSYREMSEVVGIPEKTIKSRLFSARKQLKDILLRKGIVR
jgi:RNA polymerase sigma-70 factor (ECF subfamily)